MQNHPYFNVPTFDKSYTQVNRSKVLSWNKKSLINHVITWQEQTDKDGKLLNRVCFESNSALCRELGIAESTLERMIRELNRTPFFKATPFTKYSEGGTIIRGSNKVVNMPALVAFLEAEEAGKWKLEKEMKQEPVQQPEVQESAPIEPVKEPALVRHLTFEKNVDFMKDITADNAPVESLADLKDQYKPTIKLEDDEDAEFFLAIIEDVDQNGRSKYTTPKNRYPTMMDVFNQEINLEHQETKDWNLYSKRLKRVEEFVNYFNERA